ncbi:chemotaxis protein CheA [Halosimplex carlsbadense 2-9-1]|uniref:Chemotaxis protein CheA n=1 Tax=Halosimplex carlsbadense 2-9-1 TaxID=797114 RepID=M0CTK4_9EURY|nr:chemotaxis protein CheA [Halosimplex carlsbadense]ELZ25747.1 chemotaxis protein CheA [Halosimplex carlsbadense 2-9-1]
MDDQYLDAFIRESEEAITDLNNSLLDLEADPDDQAAMDQIFRTAHTLKGNFGAMGFEDASDLAHAIEDLLDAMRQDEMAVTPERMDLIFAGVDTIEVIVREIESEGESTTDTAETVAQLRAVLEESDFDSESGGAPDPAALGSSDSAVDGDDGAAADGDDAPPVENFDVSADDAEGRVVRADVSVGEGDMLGVDAMLALDRITATFDLLDADPGREAVESGEFEDTFALALDAPDADAAAAELDAIGAVEDADVVDVTDALAGADDGGADESDAGDADGAGDGGGPDPAGDATPAAAGDDDGAHVDEIKSVRVDVDQLDDLHGLVEQLVTSRIKLRRAVETDDLAGASENLNELDKITANLQNTVMDMRLIPLKKVVGKFPRMVRDLSRELDKDVEFTIEGEDIELDRTILTEISDPLMHIIRNALDHGIEAPAEREAAGKDPTGQVELRASRERDHVIIEVEDDGAGLDVEGIERKAIEKGVRSSDEIEAMSDSAIYDLVFHPGFSTADEVTDTSGRGVGMDVVHDTVTQLDGSVSVDSEPGEGTTVSLRLPVTMAIVKVLFVEVGDEEYGVPLKNVDEITRTSAVKQINGNDVIKHNDDIYPVVDLAERFDVPGTHAAADAEGAETAATDGGEPADGDAAGAVASAGSDGATGAVDAAGAGGDEGMLVRIRESERQVALRCDQVNSQEEVVVKPLEGILSGTPGLSGTAVLGDGNIVHILDVVTL